MEVAKWILILEAAGVNVFLTEEGKAQLAQLLDEVAGQLDREGALVDG